MQNRRDDDDQPVTGQALLYLLMPLVAICLLGGVLAWIAARRGAPRWVVGLLCFPAVFAVSNVAGLCLVVGGSFCFAVARGTADALLYQTITDYLDLTLFVFWGAFLGWVWNFDVPLAAYAPQVPWWHIAVFQVGVWVGVARPIAATALRILVPPSFRA